MKIIQIGDLIELYSHHGASNKLTFFQMDMKIVEIRFEKQKQKFLDKNN